MIKKLSIIALCGLASSVYAIDVYEGYDYATGVLDYNDNGGTGWNTSWRQDAFLNTGANNAGGTVISTKTWDTFSGYGYAPTGNATQKLVGSNFSGYRQLTAGNQIDFGANNTVYFSFLFNKTNANNQGFTFAFGDGDLGGNTASPFTGIQLGAGADGNGVQPLSTNGTSKTSLFDADLSLGTDYLIVGRLTTFANGTSNDTIAFNIYTSSGTASTPLPGNDPNSFTYALGSSAQTGIASIITFGASNTGNNYSGNNFGNPLTDAIYDELRIGDTWESVAIPETSSLILMGVALGACLMIARRRK